MFNHFLSCLCMLICLCSAPTFAQTTLPLGKQVISLDNRCVLSLVDDQGRIVFSAQTMFFAKGWRTAEQARSDIQRDGDTMTWKGKIIDKASGIACDFQQAIQAGNDQINMTITLTPQGPIPVEDVPFVNITLPLSLHNDQTIHIGKPYKLPAQNKWGWGTTVKLDLTGNKLIFSEPAGMSVWQTGKPTPTQCDVRIKMIGPKLGEGKTISQPYRASIIIPVTGTQPQTSQSNPNQPVAFVGQVDVIHTDKKNEPADARDPQKEFLINYQRVLSLPAAPQFDHRVALDWIRQGLTLLADNQSAKVQIDNVQSYLQSLSIAYDLQSRSEHLKLFESLVGKLDHRDFEDKLAHVLNCLKQGQTQDLLDSAKQTHGLAEALEKQAISSYGNSCYPGQSVNVHSWVKALYLNGYQKHRDGLNAGEPYPWHIAWDTGLSLALPGDKTDYSVTRTWTTNTWHHHATGMKAYFSILTPVSLIEQVDSLTLDIMSSPVTHLLTPDQQVSTLAGKNDPITMPALGDNWFALRTGKGVLLLFTGAQPLTLQRTDNQVGLKWDRITFVAMLCLPASYSSQSIVQQARFWSNVVVDLPMEVVELVQDKTVEYRYSHRKQQDIFNRTPMAIAPIPHLATLAGDVSCKTLDMGQGRNFSYHLGNRTKWPTDSISLQPMYRGLNDDAKHLINPGRAQQWVDMGATSVRVCIYHQSNEQDGYDLMQGALEQCHKVGLKVLIDPHDFIYKTTSKGLPTEPDAPENFAAMWEKLATLSQPFGDTVIGYDLYNELRLKTHEWDKWQPIAEKAIARIRSIDRTTPIYVGSTDMSNATGYHATRKLSDANVIYSFHHYAMHSFTHQNIFQHNPREAYVFYPGWTPLIDWGAKQTYGDADLLWWDRWSMPASVWPALRFAAQNKVFLHCGEFAPVGWARPVAAEASMIWTMDAMAMLEQRNIVWHLWNKGFGLVIPEVKDKVTQIWHTRNTPYRLPR